MGREGSGGPDAHGTLRQSAKGPGRLMCALEMEMTNYNFLGDSKLDGVNYDGLITRNGGGGEPAAQVSVPLTQRSSPMEGDNLYRLRDRKFLLEDKKRLCALALGTAVLGIVLMIIHAETCPFVSRVGLDNCKALALSHSSCCFFILSNCAKVGVVIKCVERASCIFHGQPSAP